MYKFPFPQRITSGHSTHFAPVASFDNVLLLVVGTATRGAEISKSMAVSPKLLRNGIDDFVGGMAHGVGPIFQMCCNFSSSYTRIVLFDSKTIKLQSFGDAGCHRICCTFTNWFVAKKFSSKIWVEHKIFDLPSLYRPLGPYRHGISTIATPWPPLTARNCPSDEIVKRFTTKSIGADGINVWKFTASLAPFDCAKRQLNAITQQSNEFQPNSMSSLHSIKFCVYNVSLGMVFRSSSKNGCASKWNVSVQVFDLLIFWPIVRLVSGIGLGISIQYKFTGFSYSFLR